MSYFDDLLESAQAPSFKFPELLFHPMCNNFGDIYFTQDPEDYDSEAVKVDGRFTRSNLSRIRSKIKRVDRYLEAVSLYDDYMNYLIDKYGGIEFLRAYIESGDCTDYIPQERPTLKKNSPFRKVLKMGIIPSITPPSIDPTVMQDHFLHLMDIAPVEGLDEGEPDPFLDPIKPSKAEAKVLNSRTNRLARKRRVASLFKDKYGVSSGLDFIEHWYSNLGATTITTGKVEDESGLSLTERMKQIVDREYMTEADRIIEDMNLSGDRYFNGSIVVDRLKKMNEDFLVALQEEAGVDVLGTMGKSMDKSTRKVIRARTGQSMGMTKKEIKKAKKKGLKLDAAAKHSRAGHKQLRDVLLNNKITMDGSIRFEDLSRDIRFAEDDGY